MRGKAETVGTDHHPRVHGTACADHAALTHGHSRMQRGVGPHHRIAPQHHMRTDARTTRDPGTRTNDREGGDVHIRFDHGQGVDARQGIDGGLRQRLMLGAPPLGEPREVQVRVVGDDAGAAPSGGFLQGGRNDQRTRLGGLDLMGIAGLRHKSQLVRPRAGQRRQAGDHGIG
ncbi:hypothetical protein D9M68_840810 [compost metagenome]